MTTNEVYLVLGMMAVTVAVRYPVLVLVGRISLPQRVLDALKFIPPAVLTAIIVPAVLTPAGQLDLSYTNAYLVAGLVAALLAWRTRNLLATILVGMLVFLVWRWWFGA